MSQAPDRARLPEPPGVPGIPPPAGRDRLATELRRLSWPVAIFWVAMVVILNPFASGLSAVINDGTAAYLPASAPSTRVAALQQQAQHGNADIDQAVAVFTSGSRLTAGDLAAVACALLAEITFLPAILIIIGRTRSGRRSRATGLGYKGTEAPLRCTSSCSSSRSGSTTTSSSSPASAKNPHDWACAAAHCGSWG